MVAGTDGPGNLIGIGNARDGLRDMIARQLGQNPGPQAVQPAIAGPQHRALRTFDHQGDQRGSDDLPIEVIPAMSLQAGMHALNGGNDPLRFVDQPVIGRKCQGLERGPQALTGKLAPLMTAHAIRNGPKAGFRSLDQSVLVTASDPPGMRPSFGMQGSFGCVRIVSVGRHCRKMQLEMALISRFLRLLLFCFGLICGCHRELPLADQEATRLDYQSVRLDLSEGYLQGYVNGPAKPRKVLHVYLEGDGRPYRTRHAVASDPNARNPIMLRLMRHDGNPSIYLVRPCYAGYTPRLTCSSEAWTDARYGKPIVEEMVEALDAYARARGDSRLILIGHSGGATLALLIANRLARVTGVVTLAGNLDTGSWVQYHRYSPLDGSINPRYDPKRGFYWERHVLADQDREIPLALSLPAAKARPQAQVEVVQGVDHSCCWDTLWRSRSKEWLQAPSPRKAVESTGLPAPERRLEKR